MSIDLQVYLERTNMPTPAAWARAIRDLGFAAALDEDFDVDQHTGFLPCRYGDKDAGFEYFAGELSPDERSDLGVPEQFDFSVTFRTHSDMDELATSVICAAVLCHLTQGVLVDPQAGDEIEAASALEWAKQMLEEIASS
jgi:hypothetical protein